MKKQQASPQLTQAVLDAVDNQLHDLKPPEAKETYERLIASGQRSAAFDSDCAFQ